MSHYILQTGQDRAGRPNYYGTLIESRKFMFSYQTVHAILVNLTFWTVERP